MPLSFTGVVHFPRLQHRLATHFVPFGEFEKDAAAGTLPDFSLIEPDMASGHNDYHPALSRSMIGIKRHLEEESETTCEALNGILHFTHGPTHHWFAYECTSPRAGASARSRSAPAGDTAICGRSTEPECTQRPGMRLYVPGPTCLRYPDPARYWRTHRAVSRIAGSIGPLGGSF